MVVRCPASRLTVPSLLFSIIWNLFLDIYPFN